MILLVSCSVSEVLHDGMICAESILSPGIASGFVKVGGFLFEQNLVLLTLTPEVHGDADNKRDNEV